MSSISINSWNPLKWRYTKFNNGDSFLSVGKLSANFGSGEDIVVQSLSNYALFICLLITTEVCSKAKFKVEDENGNEIKNDPLLKLVRKPNYYQTGADFIRIWLWNKLSQGTSVVRPVMPAGRNTDAAFAKAMYVLNINNLKFPSNFKPTMIYLDSDIKKFEETPITYKDDAQTMNLKLKELIHFYDVAPGISGNLLTGTSRVRALKEQIANINIAMQAENIMLQSNGREMFTAAGGKGVSGIQMPVDDKDRREIQDKLVNFYGVSKGKVRSIVTQGAIDWKSLHMALKELGLWESMTKNAGIIRAAFQIPETIFKLYFETGDTFENKKEGEVEFIQNVAQGHLDDYCQSLTEFFGYNEQNRKLVAYLDHLPAMQHLEDRKADKLLKIATAIEKLTRAGLDSAQLNALLVDNEIDITVNGTLNTQTDGGGQQQGSGEASED